jgi:hypothetical protein
MNEAAVLVPVDLSEARARAKDVREQLRMLETVLSELAVQTPELPTEAANRIARARLNIIRASDEFLCTEASQMPF